MCGPPQVVDAEDVEATQREEEAELAFLGRFSTAIVGIRWVTQRGDPWMAPGLHWLPTAQHIKKRGSAVLHLAILCTA